MMGGRGSKQHLETAGRERQLLMGATQLFWMPALAQTPDPPGLILALRVRVALQRDTSSRVASTPNKRDRVFKAETEFLCLSP